MAQPEDIKEKFYAHGDAVFQRPRRNPETGNLSLGFRVLVVDSMVNDKEAVATWIAKAMNEQEERDERLD